MLGTEGTSCAKALWQERHVRAGDRQNWECGQEGERVCRNLVSDREREVTALCTFLFTCLPLPTVLGVRTQYTRWNHPESFKKASSGPTKDGLNQNLWD